MKQKVVTKVIIKQDGKVLLLRRSGGRPSIDGLYELPGGRVHAMQQPDDALAHAMRIHVGVGLETARLKDVMSFIDPDDRELQYIFILYEGSLEPSDRSIILSQEYDKYIWKSMSDIQRDDVTKSTELLLGMSPSLFTVGAPPEVESDNVANESTFNQLVIFSDGGSRGNPGPSAAGFVIMHNDTVISEGGAYLGVTTNNIAEYQAVYLGLEKALELSAHEVDFRMDSQLVAHQLNGIYKVRDPNLTVIKGRIVELARRFHRVTFTHIRRENNQLADGMVNKILDQHKNSV